MFCKIDASGYFLCIYNAEKSSETIVPYHASDGTKPSDMNKAQWIGKWDSATSSWTTEGWKDTNPVTSVNQLLMAKQMKLQDINQDCKQSIVSGFPCTLSDGSTHTFTLTNVDQLNGLKSGLTIQHAILSSTTWTSNSTLSPMTIISDSGRYFLTVKGGKTGTTKPSWPTTTQSTVVDNTVTWEILALLVATTNGNILLEAQDIITVFRTGTYWVHLCRKQCDAIKSQVNSASSVTEVQKVQWTSPTLQ